MRVGAKDGNIVGMDGAQDEIKVGSNDDGFGVAEDGSLLGERVGEKVGPRVGEIVGAKDGITVCAKVCPDDGAKVGSKVGRFVGWNEGDVVERIAGVNVEEDDSVNGVGVGS